MTWPPSPDSGTVPLPNAATPYVLALAPRADCVVPKTSAGQGLRAGQRLLDVARGLALAPLALVHEAADLGEHDAQQEGDGGQDGQLGKGGVELHAASIASSGEGRTKSVKRV